MGDVFVPAAATVHTYDDGNLTADGRFAYSWDAENRLAAIETTGMLFQTGKVREEYAYDHRSRRIAKTTYTWDAGTGTYVSPGDTLYLYQALFLGDISLKLEGEFVIKNDCTWEFKGPVKSFDDWYDFNASTHRGPIGEFLTTRGRNTPGKPYWIEIRGSMQLTETGSMSSHSDLGGGGGRGWY